MIMYSIYNQGSSPSYPTFLLLHGTGGRETDLLPIAQRVDMKNAILGVRGEVSEDGQNRFFKRHSDGSPDVEDLMERTDDLHDFIDKVAEKYSFDRNNVIVMGYSNGANIAASLMIQHGKTMKGAILFHPMILQENTQLPDLSGMPIFMSAGALDSRVLPGDTMKLKRMLESVGADVTLHITDYGHELVESEVEEAVQWYREHMALSE